MAKKVDTVWIWTDGSSQQHGGGDRSSGWAAVLICDDMARIIAGHQDSGTNNEMEALAVLKALQVLKRPCIVVLNTDSQYVQFGIRRIADNESLLPSNAHIWQELRKEYNRHTAVRVEKIMAHVDDVDQFNDLCDRLARKAARRKLKKLDKRGAAHELFAERAIAV